MGCSSPAGPRQLPSATSSWGTQTPLLLRLPTASVPTARWELPPPRHRLPHQRRSSDGQRRTHRMRQVFLRGTVPAALPQGAPLTPSSPPSRAAAPAMRDYTAPRPTYSAVSAGPPPSCRLWRQRATRGRSGGACLASLLRSRGHICRPKTTAAPLGESAPLRPLWAAAAVPPPEELPPAGKRWRQRWEQTV